MRESAAQAGLTSIDAGLLVGSAIAAPSGVEAAALNSGASGDARKIALPASLAFMSELSELAVRRYDPVFHNNVGLKIETLSSFVFVLMMSG